MKDFSGLQAVMYSVNVVIFRNGARWESLLLQEVICGYQIAAIRMTLSDLQGHSPTASLSKCNFSCGCAAVDRISTSLACLVVPLQWMSLLILKAPGQ